MVNKVSIMETKMKILNMLVAENRVGIGVTSENQNLWNNSKIPEDLKDVIDNVYKAISEIATDNRVSTTSVNKVIQSSRKETNVMAEILYKKKCIEQTGRIQGVLNYIKQELEQNDRFEVEKHKQNVNEQMEDGRTNTSIKEQIAQKILSSVTNIQKTINEELLTKGMQPAIIESKIQQITRRCGFST